WAPGGVPQPAPSARPLPQPLTVRAPVRGPRSRRSPPPATAALGARSSRRTVWRDHRGIIKHIGGAHDAVLRQLDDDELRLDALRLVAPHVHLLALEPVNAVGRPQQVAHVVLARYARLQAGQVIRSEALLDG